jgi:ubiquinone/menaquinone biosynthesis C-methylase UbiE
MSSLEDLQKPEVESKPLWNIVCGMVAFPAVVVAYDLKVFELLKDKSLEIEEISNQLNLEKRPAEAMLAVNVSLGLLDFKNKKYTLTMLSKNYLIESSPINLCGVMSILSTTPHASSIDSLKEAIISDRAQIYDGEDVFKSHEEEFEKAKSFTRAMHSISMAPAFYWPDLVDLSENKYFLDIAGGSGAHSIGVLNRWKNLNATVFDMEPVCEVAKEFIDQYQLSDRMSVHTGDIWETPFPKADVHFYSQIYHDWYFDKCEFLTRKSFESLPPGGKLILHEILYDDKNNTGPFQTAATSIAMMRWTEGKQYSAEELNNMLENAGFIDIKIKSTEFDYWSLIVATKP